MCRWVGVHTHIKHGFHSVRLPIHPPRQFCFELKFRLTHARGACRNTFIAPGPGNYKGVSMVSTIPQRLWCLCCRRDKFAGSVSAKLFPKETCWSGPPWKLSSPVSFRCCPPPGASERVFPIPRNTCALFLFCSRLDELRRVRDTDLPFRVLQPPPAQGHVRREVSRRRSPQPSSAILVLTLLPTPGPANTYLNPAFSSWAIGVRLIISFGYYTLHVCLDILFASE